MGFKMLHLNFCLCMSLAICVQFSFQLGCRDEKNRPVDWYINYKLPKIATEPKGSLLYEGKAYASLTSKKPNSWKLSLLSVESSTSMLGRTLQDLINTNKSSEVGYLFYNDDAPGKISGTAIGHLKGIVAFDDKTGFWLRHSIPRFGEMKGYEYPESALVNGQTAMCITFGTSALSEICNHLLYCNPNIYENGTGPTINKLLDKTAKTIFTAKPSFIRKAPFQRKSTLKSQANQEFLAFAKDNQLHVDLYSGILSPELQQSLITETWRRGSGTFLDASCKTDYSVTDIVSVNMTTANKKEGIFFKSTEDHSKWAVSVDKAASWICIGDMNRVASQKRRGGGAVCFKSAAVWKNFFNLIKDMDQCALK